MYKEEVIINIWEITYQSYHSLLHIRMQTSKISEPKNLKKKMKLPFSRMLYSF